MVQNALEQFTDTSTHGECYEVGETSGLHYGTWVTRLPLRRGDRDTIFTFPGIGFFFSLVDITWARRGADRYVLYLHRLYYTRRPLDHMENRDPGAIPNDIWRDIVQLCRDKTAAEQRQYAGILKTVSSTTPEEIAKELAASRIDYFITELASYREFWVNLYFQYGTAYLTEKGIPISRLALELILQDFRWLCEQYAESKIQILGDEKSQALICDLCIKIVCTERRFLVDRELELLQASLITIPLYTLLILKFFVEHTSNDALVHAGAIPALTRMMTRNCTDHEEAEEDQTKENLKKEAQLCLAILNAMARKSPRAVSEDPILVQFCSTQRRSERDGCGIGKEVGTLWTLISLYQTRGLAETREPPG